MKTIKQTYRIKASAGAVWEALVNQKEIEAWGGGPVKMSAAKGAKFSLWGGEIFGKNIEVKKGKLLVQEWQDHSWKKPSIVTFELSEENGVTTLKLLHEDVPNEAAHDFDQGWKDFYLGPLKHHAEKKGR